MKFPQFRKYKNNQSYFQIHSYEAFTEWKKGFGNWEKHEVKAEIHPDRVFIADMLIEESDYWDVITHEEFIAFVKQIQ